MNVRSDVVASGRWTRAERLRLSGMIGVIAGIHVVGWSMYLYYANNLAAATSFAGAGTLAYALGMRHAFDADHIAAIDDTTRLMLQRGRRPVGVGFFFAMGHSSVVFVLSLIVAIAAGAATAAKVDAFRTYGSVVAAAVAATFLLLVAALNALVLVGVGKLWRQLTRGELDEKDLELQLLNRGLMNRMLGGRARSLIRSSWHMFPVGLLFGLGLETASEVTLLTLSASAATAGTLPMLAVLTLPLLFAAGMSALDTADSLLMTRAYSWAFRSPARKLYYNLATTGMTVVVACFVGTVYLAGLVVGGTGIGGPLAAYAAIGDHFELLGYIIVGLFLTAWLGAALAWRVGGFDRKYGAAR
ncbi:MAG: HoxN/HupN/NixA family nickel/cobalt transporter [Streptosporangiales bacterium]|nr:HoxN/HupN/NixA family nickel/cobalt transporter [Streptosporangiales bacterium]